MAIKLNLRDLGTIAFGFLAMVSLGWALLPSLWPSDNALDLKIHDSYLIFGTGHLLLLIAISSAIIALVYLLVNGLDRRLTVAHATSSLAGFSGLTFRSVLSDPWSYPTTERTYVSYIDDIEMDPGIELMPIMAGLIVVGLIGQLFFVSNLLLCLFHRSKK